jgi:replicative DNA helicase
MSVDFDERVPPADLEAEAIALGSAMLNADAAGQVAEELHEEHFLRVAHQAVFRAVRDLYNRGEPVNAVTVRVELHKHAGKTAPDGAYLHGLVEQVPVVGQVGWYINRLRNVGVMRKLAIAGPRITQIAYGTPAEDSDHAVDLAGKMLEEATGITAQRSSRSVAEMIAPFLDGLEAGGDQRGVATGWADVSRLIPRLRPGQLVTIGARPGVGKSIVMSCLAYYVGVTLGLPVYVGTLEMSTDEFMARMVAHDASVNLGHILEPEKLTESDWGKLGRSLDRMSQAQSLEIDDFPGMGVAHIRASLRAMRRAGNPPALVVIDYLQLMSSGKRVESRQVEVSDFSRQLKLLAKEFEVPIVVGSQLNRDVERRSDKKPVLADLRESGSVEQDSDIVILLHRPDAYDPESPRAGEIDLFVEKNRSGPRGVATLAFQGHHGRVADMAPAHWSPTGSL